jgi:hypothetical protein
VFLVIVSQFGEAVVFAPVIVDTLMRGIGPRTAGGGIEPAAFVEWLVVRGAAGNLAEEIP